MANGRIERAFPLTSLQEGMLFHTIRDPESTLYRGQVQAVLEGALDKERFREAWERAAERHECLRTAFSWDRRERPLQAVLKTVDLDFRLLDWTDLDADAQRDRWDALLEKDRRQPFDLTRPPITRLRVARTAPETHRLLWSAYHGILDGWSGLLILGEVLEDYNALLRGHTVDRPVPPSYASFVGWLDEQDADAAGRYWQETLSGFARPTSLPGATTVERSSQRRTTEVHLTPGETAACVNAASSLRVTINTLVVAAWSQVLGMHDGSDDVVFGVTLSERPGTIPGIQSAAGLYLSTVPARVRPGGQADTGAWLRGLQQDLSEGRVHSHVGLPRIQRWSEVRGRPLFETSVVFESFPDALGRSHGTGDLRAASVAIASPSDIPLTLLAYPGERLTLQMDHDPVAVPPVLADAILSQARDRLTELAVGPAPLRTDSNPRASAGPDQGPPRDRQPASGSVVSGWAAGPPLDHRPEDVLRLFEQRVIEHPDRTAIRSPTDSRSYADLDAAATAVAHSLAAAGLGPGARVGVPSELTAAVIATYLGALKAGCAYVPFDPRGPSKRVDGIRAQTHATVSDRGVVTESSGRAAPAPGTLRPDTPAYVVFTSGSTGEPKGVVVERRHLAWSTAARLTYYREHPGIFLLLSPLTVDSSVAGLYWTLCSGGTLVLPPARGEQDLTGLAELIGDARITHALMLPSLYRMLLEDAAPERLESLRVVAVAGEPCPPDVVRLHGRVLPGAELHNEYGPSEATVWATVDEMSAAPGASVTIGRPVPGARVYIVDSSLELVPLGRTGEICIGGPGVAAGYLGQPELTAERFVPDPYEDGGRLYRTGDLGRWLEDGRVEFLGRADGQVKIRGFRVETMEIERALEAHPRVREAVVSASTAGPALTPDPDVLARALLEHDGEIDRLLKAAGEVQCHGS